MQNSIDSITRLKNALTTIIRGREDTIKLVLTGLVANGHVLLEDYPGSGKTTLAKAIGAAIDCSSKVDSSIAPFRRIQFTPDLLPTDVLGVTIFDKATGQFSFQHGPVFAHILLADEINRTGPKVQSAFLECMAERQVTIDNTTHLLDDLFFVIGTQNPLDMAGTYPLPLVQLDRFFLRIPMKYVDYDTELSIIQDADKIQDDLTHLTPVITREEVLVAGATCSEVHITSALDNAIVSIVQATRYSPTLQFGASTRAAIMLRKSLAAFAIIEGRDYATVDDLKFLAPFVLKHRLKFHPGVGDTNEAFNALLNPHIEKVVGK